MSTRELLRNGFIALVANAVGAVRIALLVVASGYPQVNGGAVGIVGGSGLVALVYHVIYKRGTTRDAGPAEVGPS